MTEISVEKQIDVAMLHRLLKFKPDSGKLFWRERPPELFNCTVVDPEVAAARWNGKFAGNAALTALDTKGYPHGSIFGVKYSAHRVIWALHYGVWPVDQIDHENGTRADNRISNLRVLSPTANQRNAGRRIDNTSGFTGVYWDKNREKWRARIKVDGTQLHLGSFENIEDAHRARFRAEQEHGFDLRHGLTAAERKLLS